MARMELRGIRKAYDGLEVLRDIDLDIADGEFIVLVGPSGCGKSTTLRMIAGLEDITDGNDLHRRAGRQRGRPEDRDIAMVFQNYALYPHMTCTRTWASPSRSAASPATERATRVRAVRRDPRHLRAPRPPPQGRSPAASASASPSAAPSSASPGLPLRRAPLQPRRQAPRGPRAASSSPLHQRLAPPPIYVTHDQEEAMTLGDRIVVMNERPHPAGRHAA